MKHDSIVNVVFGHVGIIVQVIITRHVSTF